MEEYEEKAEKWEQQAAQAKSSLREANEKIDELEALNHDLEQQIKNQSNQKQSPEEESVNPSLEKKVNEYKEQLQEQEKLLSQKMEDNFNLKEMLDKQRAEMAKVKQKSEII